MAAVSLAPSPVLQFFDNSGRPNAGGSILTQIAGVNAATYQDSAGTIPLPNPIILNSRGEISNAAGISSQLFLVQGSTYTFIQYDANLNQLNTANYVASTSTAAASLPYLPPGAGAVTTTVSAELARAVWVTDYAANGISGAPVDPTGVLDSTAGIQAAINYVGVLGGGEVLLPKGKYLISGAGLIIGNGGGIGFSTVSGVRLRGMGAVGGPLAGGPEGAVQLVYSGTATAVTINGYITHWGLSNIEIVNTPISATSIGLLLNGASYGKVDNLFVGNFGKYGIQITTSSTQGAQANNWSSVVVFMPASIAAAVGIRISSDNGTLDVWGDTWTHLYIIPAATTHTALYLGATDTNFFYHLAIQPAACKGIVFDYSFNASWPGGMFFHGMDIYNNSITNVGTPAFNLSPLNKCFNFSRVNGPTVPYIANFQIFDYAPFSRTKLYRNAAANIGVAAAAIQFDTVDTDLDGISQFLNSVNARVAPFRPGVYKVCGQVAAVSAGATSQCIAIIQKNGGTSLGIGYGNNSAGQATAYVEAWVTITANTDYIQLYGQDSSGTVALQVAQPYYTWMTVEGPF